MRPPRPWVIAHRGASGERPENTLAAYELAVEQRSDMIEVDLHLTRDGRIAVLHDDHVPGAGRVGDCSLAELRAADPRVPDLDQVLDGFGARIPFNLELKTGPVGPYPGLEEATLSALARRGLGETVLFSCFDDRVLERLRSLDRDARLGVLVARRRSPWLERCAAFAAEAVHFSRSRVDAAAVERAHAAGLAVHVYTVDEVAEMEKLLAWGVDGIFTNWPARMRALLERAPRGAA